MSYEVKCEWREGKKTIVINPDGQVWPCCYMCNTGNDYKGHPNRQDRHENNVYMEYHGYKDELNIFKNSLDKIMRHKWFTQTLPKSWEKEETSTKACKEWCSNLINKTDKEN